MVSEIISVIDAFLWQGLIVLGGCVILLIFVWILRRSAADSYARLEQMIRMELRSGREESARAARDLREEIAAGLNASVDMLVKTISEMSKTQGNQLEAGAKQIQALVASNEAGIGKLRDTVDFRLNRLQESNEQKLDQMRETVDEKLQSTLAKRIGESFKLVSERLEAVQRGLGEMQTLASGVGDLKRVLTNVKARGTWGEVQLGVLLEQILAPDQYDRNVHTKANSRESVEFAIRLPGSDGGSNSHVWLPIDSKFPQEDYLRLLDAVEAADTDAVQQTTAALVNAVNRSAREIRDKYLSPPETTDFAIMFLPTEGLYAEILRQPGQVEHIQQTYRIVVAGPTTLSAILNSLRMGFRTLALEKRSSEVWKILAGVKMEFGKFGDVLSRVKKQLHIASKTLDQTDARTRAMERKLRDVEDLPFEDSIRAPDLPEFKDENNKDETS